MRPFQRCITEVSSSFITGVIGQRVTQSSGHLRFLGSNLTFSEGLINEKNT